MELALDQDVENAPERRAPRGGAGRPRVGNPDIAKKQLQGIEAFLRRRNLTAAELCRRAGFPNGNIISNLRSGHTVQLSPHTLQRLVDAVPGATIAELLGEPAPQMIAARSLMVRKEVRLGVWREDPEMPVADHFTAIVPTPPGIPRPEDAVRVGDSHADLICRQGSLVFLRAYCALERAIRVGDLVLVHRVRAGRHELTLREVVATEEPDHLALACRTRSRVEAAVRIPVPTPYAGEAWDVDGDRYQIEGVSIVQQSVLLD